MMRIVKSSLSLLPGQLNLHTLNLTFAPLFDILYTEKERGNKEMKIWFDMDGTIADLYGVTDWLPMLCASDPTPYAIAKPLVNLSRLARALNRLQKMGYEIGVISWLSKSSTPEYDTLVTSAKMFWLNQHLPSVKWDEIKIISYGINKWEICGEGILFDDEAKNRETWQGDSYEPNEIFTILNELIKAA